MKDKRGGEGAWEFRVMCCAFTRGGVWKKGDEMLWKREGEGGEEIQTIGSKETECV